ncbi:MAG TPA: hypothetical protein VFR97_11360 [Capillimicrobium sp.]|nr:hypothetical protein [Capillimicrobium sp.]
MWTTSAPARTKRRRGLAAIAAVALLGLAPAAPATAAGDPRPTIAPPEPLGAVPVAVDDALAPVGARRARLRGIGDIPGFSGRVYRTPAGEPVGFYVSPSYRPDDALSQAYVDRLGALVHGTEISTMAVYVLTPEELEIVCPGAVACYSPGDREILILGETAADGTPIVEALVHEYGHHVAASRTNDPFPGGAGDWGTKRWATLEDVCARSRAGTAFPGDEGEHYAQNPGEAFADAYRILNGGNTADWQYDATFFPDPPALEAIRADVLQPLTTPSVVRDVRGRFAKRDGATRTVATIDLPLDGGVRVDLRTSGRLRATASVIDVTDGEVLARTSGGSAEGLICGTRRVDVAIQRRGTAAGGYAIRVTAP